LNKFLKTLSNESSEVGATARHLLKRHLTKFDFISYKYNDLYF